MICYKCRKPGHWRSQCPTARNSPPAPALEGGPEQWKPTDVLAFPARAEPAPPSPAYLGTRAVLGMPSPGHPSPLLVPCPWCRASLGSPCTNPGTGRRTSIHQARKDAAVSNEQA